jgi:hypothetical protein
MRITNELATVAIVCTCQDYCRRRNPMRRITQCHSADPPLVFSVTVFSYKMLVLHQAEVLRPDLGRTSE